MGTRADVVYVVVLAGKVLYEAPTLKKRCESANGRRGPTCRLRGRRAESTEAGKRSAEGISGSLDRPGKNRRGLPVPASRMIPGGLIRVIGKTSGPGADLRYLRVMTDEEVERIADAVFRKILDGPSGVEVTLRGLEPRPPFRALLPAVPRAGEVVWHRPRRNSAPRPFIVLRVEWWNVGATRWGRRVS